MMERSDKKIESLMIFRENVQNMRRKLPNFKKKSRLEILELLESASLSTHLALDKIE